MKSYLRIFKLALANLAWANLVVIFVGSVALFAGSTAQAQNLRLQQMAQDLTAPIHLEELPDGTSRMLIVQQDGRVLVMAPDGKVLPEPFLDLRSRMFPLANDFEERGLLGFALHPQYARNGRFFVAYSAPLRDSAPQNWNHTRRISEFTAKPGSVAPVDLNSERVLIAQDWPSRKHNGGGLAFGPDGMLFIGMGDSGASHGIGKAVVWEAFDVPAEGLNWDHLAQDKHSLYGKILRIDVDHGFPGYAIPNGNPMNASQGRPEIWAWGFRNPYRMAFDRNGSGDLYVTAIAETLWEAAYRIRGPGNFGWPLMEGSHCVDRLAPRKPPAQCARQGAGGEPLQMPVVEYANMQVNHPSSTLGVKGVGTALTGVRMYRGAGIPALQGKLVIADWSAAFRQASGQLFVATPPPQSNQQSDKLWPMEKAAQLESRVISLAEDRSGEIYVLTHEGMGPFGNTGKVYRLVAAP
jgi:glucose/arabinose dehydrogenase